MLKVLLAIVMIGAATAPAHAGKQPNPYRFPVAAGPRLPIQEGYWAKSKAACAQLQLQNNARPHLGLKGLPIANQESFPTYTFRYFGPNLGNWPDGPCFVRRIRKLDATRYSASGSCGDTGSDTFQGTFTLFDAQHLSVAQTGAGEDGTSEYWFCRSASGGAR